MRPRTGGGTWSSLGTTSFTVWDVTGPKPLQFDVTLPVDLPAMLPGDQHRADQGHPVLGGSR